MAIFLVQFQNSDTIRMVSYIGYYDHVNTAYNYIVFSSKHHTEIVCLRCISEDKLNKFRKHMTHFLHTVQCRFESPEINSSENSDIYLQDPESWTKEAEWNCEIATIHLNLIECDKFLMCDIPNGKQSYSLV